MGYDHPLEGEFEHLSKSREFAFFVARSAIPDSKFSLPLCQSVPEHDDAMFGKPYGSLETSAPVVEGNQTPWEPIVREDWLQFGPRDVVWKEEHGTESTSTVATRKQIDVSDMVWHQDHGRGRWVLVESFPQTNVVQSRSERVKH